MAIYLFICAFLYLILSPADVNATGAIVPKTSAACLTCLGFVHLISVCRLKSYKYGHSVRNILQVPRRRDERRPSIVDIAMGDLPQEWEDLFIIAFSLFQVCTQSARTFVVAAYLVDTYRLISYGSFVVFYCCASSIILFVPNRRRKALLVYTLDFGFSFAISCGLPLLGVVLAGVDYVQQQDLDISHNNVWITRTLSMARLVAFSTPFDFLTGICMHLATFISLRRVLTTIQRSELCKPTLMKTKTRLKIVYSINMVANVLWACALTFLIYRAVRQRKECPEQCVLQSSPLEDLSCTCLYLDINCYKTSRNDVDNQLDASLVGDKVLVLRISRCPLEHGIATVTLARYRNLYKIDIFNTNLTNWDEILPPTVSVVYLRWNKLKQVPRILTENVPPQLAVIKLESMPLGSINESHFQLWPNLEMLSLSDVGLQSLPENLHHLPNLLELVFLDNNISSVPQLIDQQLAALSSLHCVRFNGNMIDRIPHELYAKGIVLDLSSNPIDTAPEDESDLAGLILDGTPYCARHPQICREICSPSCYSFMQGNHICNPACFNRACAYDSTDCFRVFDNND